MRNLPEWAMAFWAITAAGAVAVPLNAWWTGPELQYGLQDSETSVVFVDSERLQRIRPHLADLPDLKAVVVTNEDRREHPAITDSPVPVISFSELLADADSEPTFPDVSIEPEDDATIFYTSGTTGKPKGAVGTHRNICTNLMSLFFINSRIGLRESSSIDESTQSETTRRAADTAYLLSVPFFHATGCHAILVSNTAAGGKLVLMHHWDPERALELIEREQITIFGGVPAMVMQVLDSPNFSSRDTSSVRSVAYGGAPAPPELVRRISQYFPSGSPSNGYGLTETSSVTTMNTGDDYKRKPDSVGPPVPVCDVAVVPEGFDRGRAGRHDPQRPRRDRRALDQGPQRGARLLEQARGNRHLLHRGLASFRRRRAHRRGRIRATSSTGRRTWSSAEARTCTRSRWRPPSSSILQWRTSP